MQTERRQSFIVEQAKFTTQRQVTYVLLAIFTGVVIAVMYGQDQSERSTILQTVINLTIGAVAYWIGMSKGAADASQSVSRIAEASAPVAAAAVAASMGATAPTPPAKVETMTVESTNTTVNDKGNAP